MATTLVAPVATETPAPRRWTVEEFDRIPDGVFPEGERVELIEGEIYTKMGGGLAHITALRYVFAALQAAYGDGFNVSMQVPVVLNDGSKPEPDVLVLTGSYRDYDMRHPDPASEIVVAAEISETSLAYDRGPKARMYAASGVPEYWILDLQARSLEVRRRPRPDLGEYAETTVLREGERVEVNGREVEVADLLPRTSETPRPL